ncbi:hypothetical protein [Frigidibacter sp. SD6-1]|uniref:hypothetical protein n=1 Tax=Frigidibacter sp. SD6-1 TaxID=3032581 RepID=UPI0024E010D2|nr:hypothetical protein [Frigidibacter sp. SD6-1]
MSNKLFMGFLGVAVLSACVSPADYETTPVTVNSPKGPVVCQLYTKQQVLWDRAVSVPTGMTVKEGDQICIAEGQRQKAS